MTTFNALTTFITPYSPSPMLFDRVVVKDGENFWEGNAKAFVERFGHRWKKTPKKGVWYIGTNGAQFTIVRGERCWDIAFYPYETVEGFKEAFEKGTHAGNAVYFRTEHEPTAPAVISFLKRRGIL